MRACFGRAATELALQRQQMQARVEQLEGYNAHLIRQLSTTLRTLRSERASSQAEITRLHQKVPPRLLIHLSCCSYSKLPKCEFEMAKRLMWRAHTALVFSLNLS